jgi:hypothetical protein
MRSTVVLETNVLHASDVIYWLDGSSAEQAADMRRVGTPLVLQLTARPRDLQVIHGAGKTALLRRPATGLISGRAFEADRTRAPTATFPLAGVVSDEAGRFIPRRFQIDAGNAATHGLVIYPSPVSIHLGPGGGLLGTLRFDGAPAPAAWAILTLVVTTAPGTTLTFRCQAAGNGDFIISLRRLPPLPEGVTHFAASLSVSALADARADTPVDPEDLTPMLLGNTTDGQYASTIPLDVVPGERRIVRTHALEHLSVRSA